MVTLAPTGCLRDVLTVIHASASVRPLRLSHTIAAAAPLFGTVMIYTLLCAIFILALSAALYVRFNDNALGALPPAADLLSPVRMTPEKACALYEELERKPISVQEWLPPSTGRKYIVVGGAGFLGGWIVLQLLDRGESPSHIRILDIRAPTRPDLTSGKAASIPFFKIDIADANAVDAAFKTDWPLDAESNAEVTIFHTAANIRFYERHEALLQHSALVNVAGTQHIIDSARAIGATALIYTSSASIALYRTRFWLWPWEREPPKFVQMLDDDSPVPSRHSDFFSNYAASKCTAERLVRAANGIPTSSDSRTLRTACIRPGNGVFGPGGDVLCGAYLVRRTNPTWIGNILQSFTYVENCALAHLNLEACLLASPTPQQGGEAYNIADAGPPVTYGDVYTMCETLTDGDAHFPSLSPTLMLGLAHVLEAYYLLTTLYAPSLMRVLPRLGGDIVNLQPSLFALTSVHLVSDWSRAARAPELGGIGYKPRWSTMEGLCETVRAHKRADGRGEERSMGGGVSFGFGLVRAQRATKKLVPDGEGKPLN